ncbi:MAG: DNA mismatch repair endonuclease MutL [Bacteroidaceae bacterium]|nr:DNA mismatch repair endonuclease MutL [Bacteroidaceae bacterium]
MSDVIRLLPDSVANQIAAGEVIQRPASLIKELVENAIDANAHEIHVLVTDAGKTSVQVIDDGKGMSETDARLAFERHATSKIREAADLFNLHTMGFRGEALASIAAVSEVELKTRMEDDELGTRLVIAGSKVVSQETTSCPKGSSFTVKNLFYNVPARRKFLKSNATELSNILTEFERIALVHPEVGFTLHSNGTEVFNLAEASAHQRIIAVFGKRLDQQLLPVNVNTSLINISGYVSKPEFSHKKGNHQYFFVNGRYMRHPYFHKAIMEAYEQLIPVGQQVSYFLYFEVDPANIDVNIHPTKAEIKFENEQSIWQILAASIKEALGKFNAIPTIDFDAPDISFDLPVFNAENRHVSPPKISINPHFNPFESQEKEPYLKQSIDKQWEHLYAGLNHPADSAISSTSGSFRGEITDDDSVVDESLFDVSERSSSLMQYKGRFILTSVKSGLMMIDQHRAHVRVLYDQYIRQVSQGKSPSQGLLFPEMIQLAPSESVMLETIMHDLLAVGFELTPLGGGSYAINGIPVGIEGLNPVELVRNMVISALEKGNDVKEEMHNLVALTLANAAAIVYGQVLSLEEMTNLVDQLFSLSTPNYTPDGHVIITTISDDEIGRMFK